MSYLSPHSSAEINLGVSASINDIYPLSDEQKLQLPTGSIFLKVSLSLALETDFDAYENMDLPLQAITIEVAYPDSTGRLVWRNTAAYVLNDQVFTEAIPMIWDSASCQRKFFATFTYHKGFNEVQLRCKIRYKNPDVPELTRQFTLGLAPESETKKTIGLIP